MSTAARTMALLGVLAFGSACDNEQNYGLPGEITYSVGEGELLPYPAGGWGEPRAINAGGWIVGFTYSPDIGANHAAMWKDGELQSLHRDPWSVSRAVDINDRNSIVGLYELDPPGGIRERHAFMLRAGTAYQLGMALVPPGDDGISSGATAINERGEVVGFASQRDSEVNHGYQAIVWHTASGPVTWSFIGTSDGDNQTVATDINELQVIVGRRFDHIDLNKPDPKDDFVVFYSFGTGPPQFTHGEGMCYSVGDVVRLTDRIAINNDNWMVGSHKVGGVCRAVRFQSSQPPGLLAGTSTTERSHAYDVNDLGVIVGENAHRPVVWTPDGELIELPMMGYSAGQARGVNNANEIVGVVYSGGGERVPVLWRLDTSFTIPPGPNP